MIKQILSLPQNTPDAVPYILSGLIPIEGQLYIKTLTFIYSIFLLPKESTENMIAYRLLYIKDYKSSSWFVEMKKIIWKYNLPDIYKLLDRPYAKMQWKQIVYEKVHKYWKEQTIRISELYKHLGYLNIYEYKPGKQHPFICIPISSVRDANRIPVKLKLVSGTYVFQANRANSNQNKVDATCLLCNAEDENMEHFLLHCSVLDEIRKSAYHDMDNEYCKLTQMKLEDLTVKKNRCYTGLFNIA
jgi:hypothetical protein